VISSLPAWPVEVDFAAVGQQMHAGAGQSLGPGEDAGQRVFLPRPAAVRVGGATPQVDNQIALHPHRNSGADVAPVGEVADESVADPREGRSTPTGDGDLRAIAQTVLLSQDLVQSGRRLAVGQRKT
jgi:hypothetical protein